MFIMVKYGDCSETLVVNPDCQSRAFSDHLRAKIPLIQAYMSQNEDEGPWLLDLCDEMGFLRYLPDKSALENVSCLFDPRCTYIPVLIAKTADGNYKNLVPLMEEITPDMDKKLKRYLKAKGQKGGRDEAKSTSPSARANRKSDKTDHSSRGREAVSPTLEKKEKKTRNMAGNRTRLSTTS